MKYLLMMTFLFSFNAYSNEHNMHKDWDKKIDKMSFEDAQKMKLEMLDEKSEMIDKEKSCVKDAKDKAGLKNCMKEWKEHKKGIKEKIKEKVKE